MDKCLKNICEDTSNTETFTYVEDVHHICSTTEQLQGEMEGWSTERERKINKNKTEVMHVGRRREFTQTNPKLYSIKGLFLLCI